MNEALDNLARLTATRYELKSHGAASRIVDVYVDRLIGDEALYNDFTDTLTDEGIGQLTANVEYATEGGADDTEGDAILAALAGATKEIAERIHERDELIRLAMRADINRSRIAAAAALTEARLYQIRDGRR